MPKYDANNELKLHTASVMEDLYAALNTLTRRIHGEFPVETVQIDFTTWLMVAAVVRQLSATAVHSLAFTAQGRYITSLSCII